MRHVEVGVHTLQAPLVPTQHAMSQPSASASNWLPCVVAKPTGKCSDASLALMLEAAELDFASPWQGLASNVPEPGISRNHARVRVLAREARPADDEVLPGRQWSCLCRCAGSMDEEHLDVQVPAGLRCESDLQCEQQVGLVEHGGFAHLAQEVAEQVPGGPVSNDPKLP